MSRSAIRLLVGGILCLALSTSAWAVPAPPFPIQLQNQDGSRVWGHLFGDEHLSWAEDLDGYSLAKEEATGAWHYARLGPDGRLTATAYRAGTVDPASLGLPKHIKPSREVMHEIRELKDALLPSPRPLVTGRVCNLVILVKFANQTTQFNSSAFEPVFNGASDSVWEYYDENSHGLVDMDSTILGWVTLPNNDTYYAYNDSAWGNPQEMVRHAADALDGQVDFSQFDCDGDGAIDAIDIVHSGPGYETTGDSRYIHSHYANLSWSGDTFSKDGVRFEAYHTEPEVRANGVDVTQIGVIVHETGHFFGLPDLYDYGYDSGGIGMWGVMCSGPWAGPSSDGTVPTHFSIWSKYKLGWVSPQHIQADTNGVLLQPADSYNQGVRIDADMPYNQYFLLENRQKQNFDRYLPGEGLLIFHVDDSQNDNDNQNRYLVDLEQADGLRELNNSAYESGDTADPWPYSGKDAFTPSSTPNSIGYTDNSSTISVFNITRSGDNVTFDVDISGATGSYLSLNPGLMNFSGAAGGSSPPAQSVSVGHQGVGPLSWTASPQNNWIQINPSSGSTPQLSQVTVNPAGLGAGNYSGSVRFTSPTADNSPMTLQVALNLTDSPPVFALSTSQLDFVAVEGANPSGQSLTISNLGGGTLSWSSNPDSAWIQVNPSSGTAPSTITIQPQAAGLSSGYYTGSVHFTAPNALGVYLDVSLSIQQPAHMAVSPSSFSFEAVADGDAPNSQTLNISNISTGSMNWTVECSPAWLSCNPSSGSAPSQVQVSVNPIGMPVGLFSGTVTVRSPVADNAPMSVPVEFNVRPENSPPGKPNPISPGNMSDIEDPNPELTLQNTSDPDGDNLTYEFQVMLANTETVYFEFNGAVEGIGFTSVRVDKTLNYNASYQWRARAVDQIGSAGEWSDKMLFSVIEAGGSGGGCGCAAGTAQSKPLGMLAIGLAFLWIALRRRS